MPTKSERDFNIDIEEGVVEETGSVQLPLNFVVIGEVENDDVKVYIHQSIYKAIERYSHSDTTRELGSILLGGYSEYSSKVHVVISDYIEAKYTDASASTLTFTHETWDYVYKEHERLHPNLKILGWQHTHPSYGIFLSNYDMFIQENFFNLPFQVAYVVDPKQNIRGFFQWKNGKVEKLRGYYIYDDVGKKISVEAETLKPTSKQANKSSKKFSVLLLCLILCVAAISASLFAVLHSTIGKQTDRQNELAAIIAAQNQNISSQNNTIKALQDELANTIVNPDNLESIQELVEKVDSQQTKINEQEKTIAELRELIGHTSNGDGVVFTYYTAERGDTLINICNKLGIDYYKNASIISSVNGIENPSRIYIGQTFLLPIVVKSLEE